MTKKMVQWWKNWGPRDGAVDGNRYADLRMIHVVAKLLPPEVFIKEITNDSVSTYALFPF